MKRILLSLFLCSYAVIFLAQTRDTTYFVYENLGSQVNSDYNESGPRISPDGSILYFFRVDHPEDLKKSNDIWFSKLSGDSVWSKAIRMSEPINNYSDNAVHSISSDGKQLLLQDVYLKNITSKAGLSISNHLADGTWSFPKPLKIKNLGLTDKVCSYYMSDDWKILIMAVQREGSLGKQDLFVSKYNETKKAFDEPFNLGDKINTKGTEATAYLTSDLKTLYFSSDSHSGSLGGFDIYKSERLDDSWTNWSKPENIGSPYNTKDDEFYFSLPAHAGGWAYLAHSHQHGHSDITRIKQVTEPIPDPEFEINGFVFDTITGQKIAADVEWKEVVSSIVIGNNSADTLNPFSQKLKVYKKYQYTVYKPGYESVSGFIDLTEKRYAGQKSMDVYLTPIRRKADWTIKGLEFATNKWDIQPKYFDELNLALEYIKEHPEVTFEIAGHTDDVGKDDANLKLSQNRAQAVVQYFVKKGVEKAKLIAVGYGETLPIAPNSSEEGRQHNRRVELIKK